MDDFWLDFDAAVAEWQLGTLPAEGLPAVAIDALSAGCDTPSLAQLAGMEHATWSEIEPVVARVLVERRRAVPDKEQAVKAVADSIARQMVGGSIGPVIGADRLHKLAWRVDGRPAFADLVPFIALWGDLDAVAATKHRRTLIAAASGESAVRAKPAPARSRIEESSMAPPYGSAYAAYAALRPFGVR